MATMNCRSWNPCQTILKKSPSVQTCTITCTHTYSHEHTCTRTHFCICNVKVFEYYNKNIMYKILKRLCDSGTDCLLLYFSTDKSGRYKGVSR